MNFPSHLTPFYFEFLSLATQSSDWHKLLALWHWSPGGPCPELHVFSSVPCSRTMCCPGPCRGAGEWVPYLDAILSWEWMSEAGAELGLGFQAEQLGLQA